MMQWLKECSESDDPPVFEAVITDVRSMGLAVEATEIMQRGMVKRETFPPSDWRLEDHRGRFTSRDGNLTQNDVLQVVVDEVNMERQFVDFRIAGTEKSERKPMARRSPRQTKIKSGGRKPSETKKSSRGRGGGGGKKSYGGRKSSGRGGSGKKGKR